MDSGVRSSRVRRSRNGDRDRVQTSNGPLRQDRGSPLLAGGVNVTPRLAALTLLGCVQMLARAQSSPVSRPAQIILIRHAEKPADPADPHLSPTGIERAKRLVSFIRTDPRMRRFGLPVAVFATESTRDQNGQRTQETVAP